MAVAGQALQRRDGDWAGKCRTFAGLEQDDGHCWPGQDPKHD